MTLQELWEQNRDHVVRDGEFVPGDLAVYGPPYDVAQICRCSSGGSSKTSRWRPLTGGGVVRLAYRMDLLVVVRPLQNAA